MAGEDEGVLSTKTSKNTCLLVASLSMEKAMFLCFSLIKSIKDKAFCSELKREYVVDISRVEEQIEASIILKPNLLIRTNEKIIYDWCKL